uniref:Uncharacterized protein n=1 Tax=Rhizophora mucronata TaxID=61149 RepID=A0A2P2JWS3_RHIMU
MSLTQPSVIHEFIILAFLYFTSFLMAYRKVPFSLLCPL